MKIKYQIIKAPVDNDKFDELYRKLCGLVSHVVIAGATSS